jgi:hypothetical protein
MIKQPAVETNFPSPSGFFGTGDLSNLGISVGGAEEEEEEVMFARGTAALDLLLRRRCDVTDESRVAGLDEENVDLAVLFNEFMGVRKGLK